MAENPHRCEVAVEIGGKTRKLRYDLNALASIGERFGLRRMSDLTGIARNPAPQHLLALLHVGLLHEDPELTEKEIGSWTFDMVRMQILVGVAFVRAYRGGTVEVSEDDVDPTKAGAPASSSPETAT